MSGLWGIISSSGNVSTVRGEIFVKGVGFQLCESDRVRFWFDDWMGIGLLHVPFPRVFRIASNKES